MARPPRRTTKQALALRRGVLAVSVLHDVDIEPNLQGVRLPGRRTVFVPWNECRRALAGLDPESDDGRLRLAGWLQARSWAGQLPLTVLQQRLRPVGLPVDHLLHPGPGWARQRILGDALDLGLGAVGLDPHDEDRVVLLPPTVFAARRLDAALVWPETATYLERMGRLAADGLTRRGDGKLRPVGDCDVVTLLGARTLRAALAKHDGGLGQVVAPMRTRGWTHLALVDAAFAPAAWEATDAADRGFPRPLLVTRDEVVLAQPGGDPMDLILRDPVLTQTWDRDVLYR
jgi:hypothetical protein